MTDVIYGALPAEWDAFTALARADLLPYLADPTVKMSDKSRVTPGNKTPGYIRQSTGLGVGILAWPAHHATPNHINEWRSDNRHGICLICRDIRAVDIDVPDMAEAQAIEGAVRDYLGIPGYCMPLRTREGTGKRALLFRVADPPGPLRKWRIPTPGGVVEFLFDKQQTVVAGQHPSGGRYLWPDGFPTRESIPTIEMETLIGLIADIKQRFGADDFDREWGVTLPPALDRAATTGEGSVDPAVAYLAEHDLIVEHASDGGIFVRCPWEHEHTGETKYDAAKYFPMGVGRPDPGFNCFHAHCTGRDHHAFLEAIGYVASEFPVVEQPKHVQSRPKFTYRGSSGIIEATLSNIVHALGWTDGIGIYVVYDTFRDAILYRMGDADWAELNDDAYTLFRLRLHAMGMDPTIPKQYVIDAVSYTARQNTIDSAQKWVGGLTWDGVKRVQTFATRCLQLEDTAYHRAVSEHLWSAMAGRALEPGVKVDAVTVLSGAQGQRKTTFCETLVPSPNEFAEVALTERDADLARMLRGKLVVNWDELKGLETRDAESIKAWITRRTDEWIPKFKEFGTTRLRRFVVIATSNRPRYLNDPTGARRYLPLTIPSGVTIDTAWLEANRLQLWAEGAELFRRNGVMWQEADRLAGRARRDAETMDVWTQDVADWLAAKGTDGWSSAAIAHLACQVPKPQCNRTVQERIRRVMTYLGWVEAADGRWLFDLA